MAIISLNSKNHLKIVHSVSLWKSSSNSCVSWLCMCTEVVSHGSNLENQHWVLLSTSQWRRLYCERYTGITIPQLVPFRRAFRSHRPDLQHYFDVMNTQEKRAVHFSLMVCQNQIYENTGEMCNALISESLHVLFEFWKKSLVSSLLFRDAELSKLQNSIKKALLLTFEMHLCRVLIILRAIQRDFSQKIDILTS